MISQNNWIINLSSTASDAEIKIIYLKNFEYILMYHFSVKVKGPVLSAINFIIWNLFRACLWNVIPNAV